MIRCPDCESTNVERKLFRSESFSPNPFAEYYYECKDCKHWWWDRYNGGKGVI